MSNTSPWAVLDGHGAGWGRYATREEAEARVAELRRMRHSESEPQDPTAQFDVFRMVG